jgi:hypothetical protein
MVTGLRQRSPRSGCRIPYGHPQQPSNVALVPQNLNLNVVKKKPALQDEGLMHWL